MPVDPVKEGRLHPEVLEDLVFRVRREQLQALRELSARTRVRQSSYLREAIEDLLAKHAAKLEGGAP